MAGFQLLFPLGLLAALAAPLLVLAYLRKQSARRQVVSSVLVLRELTKRPALRKRFSPPLRFFLELLALLLLVLAATLPSRLQPQDTIAILVDTSLSMSAKGQGATQDSRLMLAQKAAEEWALEQGRDLRFVVYQSAPRLQAVGNEEGGSRGDVRDSLRKMQVSFTGDALETSIRELAQSGRYERVAVFSDREPEYVENEVASEGETSQATRSTHVVGFRVGQPSANIWISSFGVVHETIPVPHDELAATVSASGAAATGPVRVSFSERLPSGEFRALGDATGMIGERGTDEIRQTLDSTSDSGTSGRTFRATVRKDRGGEDSILDDNSGWSVDEAQSGSAVLLVSNTAGNDLGLGRIRGLRVLSVDSEGFNAITPDALKEYAMIVFHRVAPSRAIERPSLYVLPPGENTIFPVKGGASGPRIASWREEHPLNAYLKVPLLRVGAAEVFDVPVWAEGIINAEQGSILVAGESRSIRLVAAGFELLPFEGVKTPVLSVLLLNTLHWLSGAESFGDGLVTGDGYRVSRGTWDVSTPTGEAQHFNFERDESIPVPIPGIYSISSSSVARRAIAVNAFHSEESQTAIERPYSAPRMFRHVEQDPNQSTSVWPWLLMAVLAVVLIELLTAILLVRKEAKRSRSVLSEPGSSQREQFA